MRISSNTYCAALAVALTFSTASAVINYSQNTPNPFQGQNLPPNGQSIDDFPVEVYALVEDLCRVDETFYTFTILFGLLFQYEDPQTVEYVMSDDTANCSFYCASDPTITLNSNGDPACCSRAFIPGVQAVNLIAYDGQYVPAEYQLSVLSNSTVAFYTRAMGTFSTDLRYGSYPLDRHYFSADFQGSLNVIGGLGGTFISVVNAKVSEDPSFPLGLPAEYDSSRPSLTAIDLPAWQVVNTHFEVMQYTTVYAKGGKSNSAGAQNSSGTLPEFAARGFRISLEVQRSTTAFYVVVEILPICLIVVFSFSVFSLPRGNVKARFNVLAGLFLTLIVLQFVLYSILPASFQVINPYILICVSYVVNFAMCAEVSIANLLEQQYKRNLIREATLSSKRGYHSWRSKLFQGEKRPPAPTKAGLPALKAQDTEDGDGDILEASVDSRDGSYISIEEGRVIPTSNGCVAQQQAFPVLQNTPLIYEHDERWLRKWRDSSLFRIPWFREAVVLWVYMGRPESKGLCYYVAKRFDKAAAAVLGISYLITIIVIFSRAAATGSPAADSL